MIPSVFNPIIYQKMQLRGNMNSVQLGSIVFQPLWGNLSLVVGDLFRIEIQTPCWVEKCTKFTLIYLVSFFNLFSLLLCWWKLGPFFIQLCLSWINFSQKVAQTNFCFSRDCRRKRETTRVVSARHGFGKGLALKTQIWFDLNVHISKEFISIRAR